MSLLSRVQAVSAKARTVQTAISQASLAQPIRDRAEQLATAARTLASSNLRRSALAPYGEVTGWPEPAEFTRVLAEIDRRAPELARPDIGGTNWGPLAGQLEGLLNTTTLAVTTAVQSRKAELEGEAKRLRALLKVPGIGATAGNAVASADRILAEWVPGEKNLSTLLERWNGQMTTMRGVQLGKVSPEVTKFFELLARPQGADIEAFTDDVRQWFAEQKLLPKLKLTYRS